MRLITVFTLFVLLTGCGSTTPVITQEAALVSAPIVSPAPSPTDSIPSSPQPSSVTTPSPTIPAPSVDEITPTSAAESTFTQPAPTQTSQPTAMPANLSASGPWLLIYPEEVRESGWTTDSVMNADGSVVQSLNIPLDEFWNMFPCFSPASKDGYFAMRVFTTEEKPEIWVFKLPGLSPIRRIPLLSEAAIAADEEYYKVFPPVHIGPAPVRSSLWKYCPMQWSNNGRYLAIASAAETPSTDLYVYDTQTDTLQHLTSGPHQTVLLSWSPDDRWIVHAAVEWFSETVGYAPNAYWVASRDGSQIVLLHIPPEREQTLLSWVSDTSFVSLGYGFESLPSPLFLVNVETGFVKTLYDGYYTDAAVDVNTGDIVLNMTSFLGPAPEDIVFGYYWLAPTNSTPQLILPGDRYYWLDWIPQLGAFVTVDRDTDTAFTFNTQGEILQTFSGDRLHPSPDGKWIVVEDGWDQVGGLYVSGGEIIVPLDNICCIQWLQDSSGFYLLQSGKLWRYMLETNWQPILVSDIPDGTSYQIIP